MGAASSRTNGSAPAVFLAKPFNVGAVMATESLFSHELKTLHEELSISQKERATSTEPGAGLENMVGPTAKPQEGSELHDELRQFAGELKDLFDGADKRMSVHPTQSVLSAMLLGILIGRLLGRR